MGLTKIYQQHALRLDFAKLTRDTKAEENRYKAQSASRYLKIERLKKRPLPERGVESKFPKFSTSKLIFLLKNDVAKLKNCAHLSFRNYQCTKVQQNKRSLLTSKKRLSHPPCLANNRDGSYEV